MNRSSSSPAEAARSLGRQAMSRLREFDVCVVEDGLSDAEIAGVEETFGFRFAEDHRAFLAAGLPVNTRSVPDEPGVTRTHREPWPDWRHHDAELLRSRLARPVDGVLFDVQHGAFWHDAWGARPNRPEEAVDVARRRLARVPTLVPIYGHRFLPAGALTYGHPVMSVWQSDIIYYGMDIADYIDREFGGIDLRRQDPAWNPQATVRFWRDLV